MPLAMDTRLQNFWVENIEKEAALRFEWQLRYSKEFAKKNQLAQDSLKPPAPPIGKSFKQNITEQIERIGSNEKNPSSQHSARKSSSKKSGQKKRSITLRDMRPPTANTKSLLYDGISAHGEGKLAYLTKRKFLSPEEKFEFPVLSSCQYGWKILDYVKEPNRSKFARTCIVRDTFYRSSGIDL